MKKLSALVSRITASMLMIVIMLGLMTGCGTSSQTKQNNQTIPTHQANQSDNSSESVSGSLEPFSIVLDWYPNAIHTMFYIAKEKGYFKEAGLDVKILFPANPNDAMTMPAAGQADLGLYYPADVLLAIGNEQVPLKVVGSLVQEPLSVTLSLKEKNIKTIDDFEGKTIGHAARPLDELSLRTIKKADGSTIHDLHMQDVGFDLLTALTTGQVDAVSGCLINHEVPVLKEKGFDIDIMFPSEHGVPPIAEVVFVTGEQVLNQKSDQMKRFFSACKKGFEDMKADPDAAIDLLLKYQEADAFPLSKSVEQLSIKTLLPKMETTAHPFLSQNHEEWRDTIKWLKDSGLLKRDLSADDILVDVLNNH